MAVEASDRLVRVVVQRWCDHLTIKPLDSKVRGRDLQLFRDASHVTCPSLAASPQPCPSLAPALYSSSVSSYVPVESAIFDKCIRRRYRGSQVHTVTPAVRQYPCSLRLTVSGTESNPATTVLPALLRFLDEASRGKLHVYGCSQYPSQELAP
jgi:hypothetical protein